MVLNTNDIIYNNYSLYMKNINIENNNKKWMESLYLFKIMVITIQIIVF